MKITSLDRDARAARLIGRLGLRAVVARSERRVTLEKRIARLQTYRVRGWHAATRGSVTDFQHRR